MRALVSGAAGFIGAALVRRLLEQGDSVIGIDSFLDSYSRDIKCDRLSDLESVKSFKFVEASLTEADLATFLTGVDCVFHLAAQAGVRSSWGRRFEVYTDSNILATQKLLEAAKRSGIRRFVYSSSSSVYGNAETMPTPEDAPLRPISPYAVSKLAGEHLCSLYLDCFDVPTVALRYFTVYGPKPRPDQAICIFTRALMEGREIDIFGDGEQLRGMTYVDDVVTANLLAAEMDCIGQVINIGGGSCVTVNELIFQLERITGRKAIIVHREPAIGDARHTMAEIRRAKSVLGWEPHTDLAEGLERVVESIRDYYY